MNVYDKGFYSLLSTISQKKKKKCECEFLKVFQLRHNIDPHCLI
jgi:hypothetical protein